MKFTEQVFRVLLLSGGTIAFHHSQLTEGIVSSLLIFVGAVFLDIFVVRTNK